MNFTVLKKYPQIFKKKLKILKKNLVKRVVAQFNKNTYNNNETNGEDEMIIPPQLFEIPKKILFLQVPFCEANEKRSRNFLNKFYNFTNEKFELIIRWKTQNLKYLFLLKVAAPDMRYFTRSKPSRGLVHKKNFSLI